jgi:hypothetical protein
VYKKVRTANFNVKRKRSAHSGTKGAECAKLK